MEYKIESVIYKTMVTSIYKSKWQDKDVAIRVSERSQDNEVSMMKILHKLSKNFIQVYDTFECYGDPNLFYVPGESKTPSHIISESGIKIYCVIMELLEPIPKDVSQRCDILIQIARALDITSKKYGFIHHDLYERNVMVRKNGSKYEAVIFDLETSCLAEFKVQGVAYDITDTSREYGVDVDLTTLWYDLLGKIQTPYTNFFCNRMIIHPEYGYVTDRIEPFTMSQFISEFTE